MNELKEVFKKYGVYIAIGMLLVYLLYKYAGGNKPAQISTTVIPGNNTPTDQTALAQLSAQFQLGKLQLQSQSDIANKQIEAEKQRLDYANQALQIQGNYGLQALQIEAQKVAGQNDLQKNLAQIALDQTSYDTQTRANAALELQRQAANQSYLNQLLGIGNGVLSALFKSQQQQQQQQQARQASGASGGSSPNNVAFQNYQRQSALAQLKAYLSGKATQQYYSPVSSSTGAYALGPATGYDLQQFYNNEIQAFDNYLGFNPFGYSPNGNPNGYGELNQQPFGGLSIADYFGFSSEADLLNNYGYGDIGSFLNDYYYE